MTRRAILPAVVASLLAVGAFPALSQQAANTAPDARPEGDVDVNSGRFLAFGGAYGELRLGCIRCHEIDGSGNSSGAFPRLSDQNAWYLYKTLLDYAAGLRPSEIMQPIAQQLSMEEIQNLAAYYASVEDAPYPAEPMTDVNVLQQGGAIAAIGIPEQGVPACVSCHGPSGIGSQPIYPYLAGQFAPYLEHQLVLWKTGRRGGDPLAIMAVIARNMTEQQMRAVSLYFSSIRPAEVTPDEPASVGSATMPASRFSRRDGSDMGAIRNPKPGSPAGTPSAEPKTGGVPSIGLPAGPPRQPLPAGGPPEPSEAAKSTTTPVGERPVEENETEASQPPPDNAGD